MLRCVILKGEMPPSCSWLHPATLDAIDNVASAWQGDGVTTALIAKARKLPAQRGDLAGRLTRPPHLGDDSKTPKSGHLLGDSAPARAHASCQPQSLESANTPSLR